MEKEHIKRIRLIKIWEILSSETDEDNPMTTEELRARLCAFGIDADRRTIYKDIEILNDFGYEIMCKRAKSNEYYVIDRKFSIPEIQILIDAVQAAKCVTERKTDELIDKLSMLAGSSKAEVLKQNIVEFSTVKNINESIYYSVNEISTAINASKKIGFYYFDYDTERKRVYRKDRSNVSENKFYIVNPLATVFSNDNYYLFCYDDKHGNVVQYRVDRMDKVKILDEDITPSRESEDFSLSLHKRQLFDMFGGKEQRVSFTIDISLLDMAFDKFGDMLRITHKTENTVYCNVEVQTSPTFLAWCCSFEDKLKVIAPKSLVNDVKAYIKTLSEHYGE